MRKQVPTNMLLRNNGVRFASFSLFFTLLTFLVAPGTSHLTKEIPEESGSNHLQMMADAPTGVLGYAICTNGTVPAGEGLIADCATPCPPGTTIDRLTWWDDPTGGTMVGTGSPFDPVAAGAVDPTVSGITTLYAQCECDTDVSTRVPADFEVLTGPATTLLGAGFACSNTSVDYEAVFHAGSTYNWLFSSTAGAVSNQSGNQITIVWGNFPGSGPHNIIVEETDADGCSNRDTLSVFLQSTQMACNDTVQISLDTSGFGIINPDMILEGTYNTFEGYTVEVRDRSNRVIGNTVDCRHAGQALRVSIINECDQNSCWGTITIEDKTPPRFVCPTDVIEINCYDDIDTIAPPIAIDNCDTDLTINLVNQVQDSQDPCDGILFTRTWLAVDDYGNRSATCEQYIQLLPPVAPLFPEDITWTCEQYEAFPNIVNPTALHPYLKEFAAEIDTAKLFCQYDNGDDVAGVDPFTTVSPYWLDAEDLDVSLHPAYDDNVDNPLTDPNPNRFEPGTNTPIYATFGNPSPETDNLTNVYNTSLGLCPLFDTIIDTRTHIPDTIITPIFRPSNGQGIPIRGLEDGDIFENTGSGVPSIMGSTCNYTVTYVDERIEACVGVDTSVAFKILRTWTIMNMCTGEFSSDLQLIKVVDKIPPKILTDSLTVFVNTGATPPHGTCTSTGLLLPPNVWDNCSDEFEIQIFTSKGEAIYVNGVDGRDGGYIPAPGLPIGVHDVKYAVTDACGNRTEKIVKVRVVDNTAPAMICSEFTDVSLTIDGKARVCAPTFDEGSYDLCGIDSFVIKRMNEPDADFRPCMDFFCDDDTVMVVLRAYDYSGNHNECMVEVRVQDKLRPECYAPDDVWIPCIDIPDYADLTDTAVLRQLFGEATGYDNCEVTVVELTPNVNVDQCGSGTILRRFRAIDQNGQTSSGACNQRITIMPVHDYVIHFPEDWIGECHAMENADTVEIEEIGCDQIAINYSDLRFDISSDGACYKIIRTWYVMNWCSYDGVSDPIRVPYDPEGVKIDATTYGAHGFYRYEQLIKVIDDEAPVLSYDGPTEFCGGQTQACTGFVNIYPDIVEDCTADLEVSWKLDLNRDGSINANGLDSIHQNLPFGEHRITFHVLDGCYNHADITIDFEVVDCKKPTPVCHNGVSIDIMQTGMVSITWEEFDNGSFDFCTPQHQLRYRLNRITDRNGDGQITAADHIMTVPQFDTVVYLCKDLGLNYVQLWVGDNYDNWDYCTAFIEVQDNMGACTSNNNSKVAGAISTEDGNGVQDVKVSLSGGSQSVMTSSTGAFNFPNVPNNNDYTLVPQKDTDPLNGVSTFDLVMISRHILHTNPLNSPYKIIAADVNRSGTVTTLDMVELRKLILRVSSRFSNNTSWRFIDKDYFFPNPDNPFSTVFPEIVNINNLDSDQLSTDFVAVKVGDVNGDARTNTFNNIGNRDFRGAFNIEVSNKTVEAGQKISVPFHFNGSDVIGYQFSLEFDKEALQLEEIVENSLFRKEHFGTAHLNDGILTASWFNPQGVSKAVHQFELVFKVHKSTRLNEVLEINSVLTEAEAYSLNGEKKNVNLVFDDGSASLVGYELYQNKPNPFDNSTIIGFKLPENSPVELTVFDMSGKQMYRVEQNLEAGYHEVQIAKDQLNGHGMYYYRLATPAYTASKKMMLLR
jgi:hypothetical protein